MDYLKDTYNYAFEFLSPLSLKQTYKRIANAAMELVNADFCTINLEERNSFKRVFTTHPRFKVKPRKDGFIKKVYETKKGLIVNHEEALDAHPEFKKLKMKSSVIVPLMYGKKPIGVLSVISRKKNFTEEDKEKLQFMGTLSSLAIRKASLYAEVKDSLRVRDLFISLAAHELRTPITTAFTYSQLIKRKIERNEKFDPKWIDTINEELNRLTFLTNELLEINQIRKGRLSYHFEELNPKDIIEKSITNFKSKFPQREVILNCCDGPLKIYGDQSKLIEVFTNLLDNAAKHSPMKSKIIINVREEDKKLLFEVSDKGKGIPKKDLQNIFEEFYKAKDNTKEGMGLGLYLSKRIIDTHKGDIIIDSKKDKGTTIRLILPSLKHGKRT